MTLITDLSPWEGKSLEPCIRAFDIRGKEVWLPDDEILCVKKGRLLASSYRSGIVEWSEEENTYKRYYHHRVTELDIAGFTDIKEYEY